MHIAVAGNIGAGKTTLTQLLAKHYRWTAQFEDVLENPYLEDFYNDMERWSFNLQVYFLNSRFSQVLAIRESGKKIIQAVRSTRMPIFLHLTCTLWGCYRSAITIITVRFLP